MEPFATDPYLAWREMDNYITNYLFEHPDLDTTIKRRIKHFQYQYLTKVSNICPLDASKFAQAISPWASLSRGDYHRFYHQSPFLQAIEEALLPLKKEHELFLLSDRIGFEAFLSSCRHLPVEELFCKASFTSVEGVDVLLAPKGDEKAALMREFIVEKGFTPTLQRAAGIAASLSLEQPNLSHAFPGQQSVGSSFSAHPVVLQFKKLAESDFLASVLVDLFEEFSPLLQDSYGRVLRYFEEALAVDLSQYLNLPKYESLLDLAHEELLLWLMIAEPYTKEMLAEAMQKTMPPAAFFKVTSTGMAAFSEILKVTIEQETNVLLFDGCYFENRASLLKSHASDRFYLVRSPDYAASLKENLAQLQQKKQTIDCMFINFHENILEGRLENSENRVGDLIAQLLASGSASSSLTVVLDHTIGFLDAPEIRELLERFHREIDASALHLVVLRSHQKFDLFGFDKVSAGSYAVYSRDPVLLQKFQDARRDEIDVVSRQVLTHYFVTAPQKLEERRARIFDNAHYVYERIADVLKYKKGVQGQKIAVALKEDRQNFSIDVQCSMDLEGEIGEAFAKQGVPLTVRSGFGFNLTTVAFTSFKLLRFSMGIEERPFMDRFVAAFNTVFLDRFFSNR